MGLKAKVQDYCQDAAMDILLRNTIIYNVAWEDPRVDQQILDLGPEDRLLMLTTGGCNVLDRLLDGVAHIVSVDLNPSQNALLELRLAAAKACTHEQFFQLFAHSNRRLFDALYPQSLRPLISPSAQMFWDKNASYFDDFFYSGASGGLARILCWLTWLFGLQPLVRALLTCRTTEEQCALMDSHETKVNRLISCFDTLLPAFCPLAGVPASQLRLLTGDDDKPISIVRLFLDRIFRKTHISGDNYFYYAYLFGKYSRQCCPRYLRPENFEALKAAAGRVTVKTKLLHEAALEYPDGYFTGMILLDHMDWLSAEQIQSEWAVFCKKLNPETGRVMWRSFAQQQRWALLKFLDYNPGKVDAAESATPDRVGMYNSTHLARVPAGVAICEPVALPKDAPTSLSWSALLRGLMGVLELLPLVGGWLAAMLTMMFGAGSAAPAATPEGSHAMLRMLPGVSDGTWVDLGGGMTSGLREGGANMDMFSDVHAVAFGSSPTDSAKAAGSMRRKLHEHTVDTLSPADVSATIGVPCGSADVVTISHSLVSEADWAERLELAAKLLKPRGFLAVCDLAQPGAKKATMWQRANSAVAAAFWSSAQPRGAAPYHGVVKSHLRNLTAEVHIEENAAKWPIARRPLEAAHFVYVGRKPAP